MGRPKKYTDKFIKREAIELLRFARSNAIPFAQDFCSKRKYSSGYLSLWAKKFPFFSEALKRFKDIQQWKLIGGALLNKINSTFVIFTMKNIAGWRDKQEVDHLGQQNVTQIYLPKQKSEKSQPKEPAGVGKNRIDGL